MNGKWKRLPDTELEVMLAVWAANGPVSRPELDERLRDRGWAATTVNTYLARLMEKGFLSCERQGKGKGKANLYTPLVREEDYVSAESRGFLERLCRNSVKNFVASAARGRGLEEEEIDELQRYLEALKRGEKDA